MGASLVVGVNTEWAYAKAYSSEHDLAATYADWLHFYNHHRPTPGSAAKSQQPVFTTSRELQLTEWTRGI